MTQTSVSKSEWWRGAIIYQIYPMSFMDSDGDGIGDLPGVLSRLDYVASLGVDAIWMSPFFTSPMDDFGYDVADYCEVDPIFGKLEDFKAILAKAHGLGLKVIIDQVWSHTSNQHPWFLESRQSPNNPKANWYVWQEARPDGTAPNNWLATFGGPAWRWDGLRKRYYLHNYLPTQPDLNLREPAVQESLFNVARFWLDMGVDGFRFDVANCFMHDPLLMDNPPDPNASAECAPYWRQLHRYNRSHQDNLPFIGRLRQLMDSYGERFMLAEIIDDDNIVRMAEYTAPERFHTAYSFAFLREPISPRLVRDEVKRFFDAEPQGWPTWAFSNHDTMRVVSRSGLTNPAERTAMAKLLNTLLLMLPGTVCVYQGEELGLTQVDVPKQRLLDPEAIAHWPHHRNRDGARTPMPWTDDDAGLGFGSSQTWLPFGADHGDMAVRAQEQDRRSVLSHFRAMARWRKGQQGLRGARIAFRHADDDVLVFDRIGPALHLRFALNFGTKPVALPGDDGHDVIRPLQVRVYDCLTGAPVEVKEIEVQLAEITSR